MGNPIKAITGIFKGPKKPSVPAPAPPPAPIKVVEKRADQGAAEAAKTRKKLRRARGARRTVSAQGLKGVEDTLLGPKVNKL